MASSSQVYAKEFARLAVSPSAGSEPSSGCAAVSESSGGGTSPPSGTPSTAVPAEALGVGLRGPASAIEEAPAGDGERCRPRAAARPPGPTRGLAESAERWPPGRSTRPGRHAAQRVVGAGDGQAAVAADARTWLVGEAAGRTGDAPGGLVGRPRLACLPSAGAVRRAHPQRMVPQAPGSRVGGAPPAPQADAAPWVASAARTAGMTDWP